MNERINGLVNARYIATFLYDNDEFYNFCTRNNVSLENLKFFLESIVDFCKDAFFPYNKKIALYGQFRKLMVIEDGLQEARIKLLDKAITVLGVEIHIYTLGKLYLMNILHFL